MLVSIALLPKGLGANAACVWLFARMDALVVLQCIGAVEALLACKLQKKAQHNR